MLIVIADENIATILKRFLDDHEMSSTGYASKSSINLELEQSMQNEIELRGLPASHMNKILHLSASLIEVCLWSNV